jgi:hypothetical protein
MKSKNFCIKKPYPWQSKSRRRGGERYFFKTCIKSCCQDGLKKTKRQIEPDWADIELIKLKKKTGETTTQKNVEKINFLVPLITRFYISNYKFEKVSVKKKGWKKNCFFAGFRKTNNFKTISKLYDIWLHTSKMTHARQQKRTSLDADASRNESFFLCLLRPSTGHFYASLNTNKLSTYLGVARLQKIQRSSSHRISLTFQW